MLLHDSNEYVKYILHVVTRL